MAELLVGLVALVAAVATVLLVVAAPRIPVDERGVPLERPAHPARDRVSERAGSALRSRGEAILSEDRLELAGVKAQRGTVLLVVVLAAAGAAVIGGLLAALRPGPVAVLLPVVLVLAVLVGARLWLERAIRRRRERFAEQLDGTLQLIAGGLRAGHSLPRAIEAVTRDTESPTSEEFARVVNEHRLGRDLDDALLTAAERMRSDDLEWTAAAVGVHREVGGNLGEVLDHIAETIRERQQLQRQVATLSAEGRVSAIVLIALPVLVAVALAVISPGYLAVFVTTPLGLLLLGLSLLLFVVGALWLRAVTRVRY